MGFGTNICNTGLGKYVIIEYLGPSRFGIQCNAGLLLSLPKPETMFFSGWFWNISSPAKETRI